MEEKSADTDRPNVMTTRLVAFMDFLGFRDVLSGADVSRQQTILAALREVADQERNFEATVDSGSDHERKITIRPAITSFSDSVLISYDLDELKATGVNWGLLAIRNMATALAHRGREFDCLLRGAITIGDIYQKDRVAFGMGLVTAYELESKTAFYPRVIVTEDVFKLAAFETDGDCTTDRALFRDADGYWCIDYMTGYLEYLGSDIKPEACTARRAWALGARAKYLDTASALESAGKTRAAEKWTWLAARFEKSMRSVSPYRFHPDGSKIEFPDLS
jgi:hypothetical protein